MDHGSFSGDPQTEWLTEEGVADRKMRVVADFTFRTAKKDWSVPSGYVVDGASIPRVLWTLIGSPYTGNYRRASIVHDKACDDSVGNGSSRRAADRMFYHACRAGKCTVRQAIIMYVGVRFGAWTSLVDAWRMDGEIADGPRLTRTAAEDRMEADFRLVAERVLDAGEADDADEIERRTDAALAVVTGLALETVRLQ